MMVRLLGLRYPKGGPMSSYICARVVGLVPLVKTWRYHKTVFLTPCASRLFDRTWHSISHLSTRPADLKRSPGSNYGT